MGKALGLIMEIPVIVFFRKSSFLTVDFCVKIHFDTDLPSSFVSLDLLSFPFLFYCRIQWLGLGVYLSGRLAYVCKALSLSLMLQKHKQ